MHHQSPTYLPIIYRFSIIERTNYKKKNNKKWSGGRLLVFSMYSAPCVQYWTGVDLLILSTTNHPDCLQVSTTSPTQDQLTYVKSPRYYYTLALYYCRQTEYGWSISWQDLTCVVVCGDAVFVGNMLIVRVVWERKDDGKWEELQQATPFSREVTYLIEMYTVHTSLKHVLWRARAHTHGCEWYKLARS